MGKQVKLRVEAGSFQQGFTVNLTIAEDNWSGLPPLEKKFDLPPHLELPNFYHSWQSLYLAGDDRRAECRQARDRLKTHFQNWLSGDRQVQKLRETLLAELTDWQEVIRLLIQTDDPLLRQLPWNDWDIFSDRYPHAEISLTLPDYHPPSRLLYAPPRERVRILGVFSDRCAHEAHCAIAALKSLPDAELFFLKSPPPEELYQHLEDERGWNILFIATDNFLQKTNIPQFKHELNRAIDRGLNVAIFNERWEVCELLANLNLPPIIIFKQPVSEPVALRFIQYFLESFARGKSFYPSVREGRERLEFFERDLPGVMGLPTICQHPRGICPTSWHGILGQPEKMTPESKIEYLARKKLLKNITKYWIEGVLEKSLHDQVFIELGWQERPDAVTLPWAIAPQPHAETRQPLSPNQSLIDYFARLEGRRTLLILGEPGSGKTVTLLKLARLAIARALTDYSQPIPVVFNLASLALNKPPINHWLIAELVNNYDTDAYWAQRWIEKQQLLLLLDGFDEVKSDSVVFCLNALNEFTQQYPQMEIVVTSRRQNYEALNQYLQFQSAVYLKPLALNQIKQYVVHLGDGMEAVAAALQTDNTLIELARTPLMLNIICLAYRGGYPEELSAIASGEKRRTHLFNSYIERMLQRRQRQKSEFSRERSLHWLSWLAKIMHQESQIIFFIDRLQPKWLSAPLQKQIPLGVGIIFGLIGGAIVGAVLWLTVGLFFEPFWAITIGLIFVVIFGLPFGIWATLTVGCEPKIQPVETLNWSWVAVRKALTVGLGLGAITALISKLSAFLIIGPLIVLAYELKGSNLDRKQFPNQGIWQSLKNAAIIAAIAAAVLSISAALMSRQILEIIIGFDAAQARLGTPWMQQFTARATLSGMLVGLFYGLTQAGTACIQHFTLRLLLCWHGQIPWNYARFLDYATERIFLQKVGSGYIFIHRLLLEHFAEYHKK